MIEMVNGDDHHQTFWLKYKDDEGELQLLVIPDGSAAKFSVKASMSDVVPLIEKANLVGGGAETEMAFTTPGELELWLVPADTEGLDEGNYYYDVETTMSGKKKTLVIGILRIKKGVT